MRPKTLVLPLVLLASPALAAGFDLPPRKPGQWEMKIHTEGAAMPPQIVRMCLDPETDRLLNEQFGGLAASMCTKQEQRKEGDSLILDSECNLGGMTSVSHTVVKGDFNSAYTMRTDITMSGSRDRGGNVNRVAPQGPATQVTTIDATHVGECAANAKPGDIDLGGGRSMNVRDMPKPQIQ